MPARNARPHILLRLTALLLTAILVLSLAGCAAPPDADFSVSQADPLFSSSVERTVDQPTVPDPELLALYGSSSASLPGSSSENEAGQSSSASQAQSQPPQPPAPPAAAAVMEVSRWYYDRLDATGQQVYLEVYNCLLNFGAEITLSIRSESLLEEIYTAVLYDHPELFWVASGTPYSYRQYDDRIDFLPNYGMTQQEAADYQSRIETERERILAAMTAALPADADDFSKALFLYEQLAYETTYVLDSLHDQNIVSCLVLHETVCAGYARSFQYLLNSCGITCTYLSGTSRDERHAWNLALLDGEWCYTDVTWGDSDTIGHSQAGANPEIIHYTYFAVSLQQLGIDHFPDLPVEELPDAAAMANSYFIRSGTLIDMLDYEQMAAAVAAAANLGLPGVCFGFVDMPAFNEALVAIENGDLFDMLQLADADAPQLNERSYSYTSHDGYPVLTLLLEYE